MSRLEKTVGARGVLVLLIVAKLLQTGASLAVNFLMGQEALAQPEWYYVVMMLMELFTFALPTFLFIYLMRPRYVPVLRTQMAFPSLPMAVRTVLAAVVGLFMFELYASVWVTLLEALGLKLYLSDFPLPNNAAQTVLAVVTVAVLPGIVEELVFRGVVMEGLRRELPLKAAVWVTALLFALMHGSISAMPVHIALGFVLTLLALRQGNLQLSMIYHFVHNATSLVFSLYVRNQMKALEASAQAAASSSGMAMFGALPLLAMLTAAYVLLLRPLFISPAGKEPASAPDMEGKPWFRGRVAVLLLALLVLMVPWFAFELLPM